MKQSSEKDDSEIISSIMQAYGLTGSFAVYRVRTGYSNRVYRVTDSKNAIRYALHILTHFSPLTLENELAIHKQLEHTGIKTATLLRIGQDFFYKRGGIAATLSSWSEGVHPDTDNMPISIIKDLGSALAKFHNAVTALPNDNDQQLLKKTIEQPKWESYDERTKDKAQALWVVAQQLKDTALPQGIIHGDFHANNIVVDGRDVTLLDMERSGSGVLLFDLARAALDLCSSGNTFSRSKSDAFIAGYEKVRIFTAIEQASYIPAVAYAALVVAHWFRCNGVTNMEAFFLDIGISAITTLKI